MTLGPPHLGVLLGHVLLGILGQLHHLGVWLLVVVAVGAIHQRRGHRKQHRPLLGLPEGAGGRGAVSGQPGGRAGPGSALPRLPVLPSAGPPGHQDESGHLPGPRVALTLGAHALDLPNSS